MYKMFSYCLSHHLWRIKAVRAALDRLFSLHFMLLGSAEGSHDGLEVEVLELCWHAANSQSWKITFPYSSGRSGTLSKQRDSITLPSSAYTSIPESISTWELCFYFWRECQAEKHSSDDTACEPLCQDLHDSLLSHFQPLLKAQWPRRVC